MNKSHILLICILWLLFLIIFNNVFIMVSKYLYGKSINNEHINNDLPNNEITQAGDSNLIIPTSNQVYNPYDTNRTDNTYSHQEVSIHNDSDDDLELVNTDSSIPNIYVHDEINITNPSILSPSIPNNFIDTGSGTINKKINVHNNAMNNFNSIE